MKRAAIAMIIGTPFLFGVSAKASPGELAGDVDVARKAPTHIELVEVIVGRQSQSRPLAFLNGEQLEGSALYEALGRSDLAAAYAHTARLRTGVVLAGIAAMIGGGAALILNRPHAVCADVPPSPTFPLPSTECHTDWNEGLTGAGLAAMGVGMVAFGIAGYALAPDPLTSGELRRAIRDHNAIVDAAAVGSADQQSRRPSAAALLPSVIAGGAEVSLSGTF